jgi:tetratricopeptide (TPR) repeat protein
MRIVWLRAALMVCASLTSSAATCESIERDLTAISKTLAHGEVHSASALLEPLAASHSDCPAVLLAQARVQAMMEDASRADGMFARYTDLKPDDATGYGYYARYLISQREYQRADLFSSLAIEKDPSNPIALAVRGQILAMKGDPNQGIHLLSQACQLQPEDAESQFQLGAIYDRIKHPGQAVEHFQRAVDMNPSDARAWDYLALNLEPLGQIDRADAAYKKALEVDQRGPFYDAFFDYNYGRFLMKHGDLTASKDHLDHAIELIPRVRAAWYERAKLNLRMKNYPQARSDAETAASLPDQGGIIIDLQVYTLLEQIYRRLGETALADKYAQLSRETPLPIRKGDR